MLRRKLKGQSALEYALVIAVAIVALIAVNAYMKRGMQGRLKESTDQIGRQWDPANFTSSWRTQSGGNSVTTESRAGGNITTNVTGETVTKAEYETFQASNGSVPAQHY